MTTTARFTCSLTTQDEPECARYARVTVTDAKGASLRGCAEHAVAALFGTRGARVDWADSRGLNEHEVTALRLAEERAAL